MNRPLQQSKSPNPWILYPAPNPNAKVRLFCLPYAGGGVQIFQNWHKSLPAEIELGLIQLPGRGRRFVDPLCTSVESMLQGLYPNFISELTKPYMLFGHSMGALLAFELIRLLRRQRNTLPVLFMPAGRCAPQLRDKEEMTHLLSDDLFRKKVAEMEGTPKEILANEELMNLLLPLLRADFQISEAYRYYEEAPLACEIIAFAGDQDKNNSVDDLKAWGEQTTAAFETRIFSGGHFFIHSKEEELLTTLKQIVNGFLQKMRL